MTKKILIIDDEPSTVKLVTNRFKKEGYEVIAANNGKTGIEMAEKEKPDLILLDVVLPGASGYDICKVIKSNKTTKTIKIIVCSNKIDAIDALKAKRSGADEFVPKLADPHLLMETVKKLI